jgi:glycosyltransferase involved in cell wall biosynthesis
MKHFVTLFPDAENVDLVKDKGQIAYQMQKNLGYKSTLVCCRNSPAYPYLETETKGLNIEFIENTKRTFFWRNAVVKYIWKNAPAIEVLNLYYLVQQSMLYGLIYKYRNPEGVLYLKLDMDVNYYTRKMITFSTRAWKEMVHMKTYNHFLKKVDIVSAESERAMAVLRHIDNRLFKKTIKLPNGLDFKSGWESDIDALFEKKENIIITVGRIGSESKNNELLLQSLQDLDLDGWEVYFIGPIAKSFKPRIEAFFRENPSLKQKVHFTGNIEDREELMRYYKRAKIFCLTSRWEAFPLVLLEAQAAGDYIIGTDRISSIEEMTKHGKLGQIVANDNVNELTHALKKATEPMFYTKEQMQKIYRHAQPYDWPNILKKLDDEITELSST